MSGQHVREGTDRTEKDKIGEKNLFPGRLGQGYTHRWEAGANAPLGFLY